MPEGRPDASGARLVAVRVGTLTASTTLRAGEHDRTSMEPLEAPAELAPRIVGVVRVESASEARFSVLARVGSRLREVATLGPFASSEESRPRVVTLGASGTTLQIGAFVRSSGACGSHEAVVDVRAIDLAHGTSSHVHAIDTWQGASTVIHATADGSPPAARFVATEGAIALTGPTQVGLDALFDAAPTTFPARSGAARIAFRWSLAPLRIRAIAYDAAPGAHGAEIRVRAGASVYSLVGPPGGGASLATFDTPIDARCLDVEIGVGEHAAGALRSFTLVPEVDGAAAAERLVTELASEGARSDLAIGALAAIGADALAPLEAAFADATPPERRRILRAAEALVPREPNALRLFVHAVSSDDEALVAYATERCFAMGPLGTRALAVALQRGAIGLADPLAARAPDVAFDPLFARLATTESSDERHAIHLALVRATRARADRGREALRRFVEGESPEKARAVALAAMTDTGDAAGIPSSLDLWWTSHPDTEEVEVRGRWLEAIAIVPAAARTGAMTERVTAALGSEVWMIRALATRAAGGDPALRAQVRARLEDPYPRVRVAAIEALSDDTESLRRVGELSRNDAWPIVRTAALLRLVTVPGAEVLIRQALTDSSSRVRLALLGDLRARDDVRFVEEAIGILERNRAPVAVELEAVRYLEGACAHSAEAVLLAHVDRALREVTERNTTLGVAAAHALERVGSADAVERARTLAPPPASHGAPEAPCAAR